MAKTAAAAEQGNQPLFYKKPVPLMLDKHGEAGLSPNIKYSFAKESNSVPLNVTEFAEACKYYPIAFTGDDNAIPVALVGLKDKQNLFVSKSGDWKKNVYIPAYVRRYPFAFTSIDANSDQFALCVDTGSDRFSETAGKKDLKFFNGKEQTTFTQNALAFCTQYHSDFTLTRQFSKNLVEQDLLVNKQVNVTQQNGQNVQLGGFRIIDEARFMNLKPEVLNEWHKNGILALVYFHFLSATNWPKLANELEAAEAK